MFILPGSAATSSTPYAVPFSVHTVEAAHFTRVGGTADNLKKQSFSFWFRHDSVSSANEVFFGKTGGASFVADFGTTGLFYAYLGFVWADTDNNDDTDWHHFLLHFDSANGTASQRQRAWRDGVELDWDSASPTITLNANCPFPHATGWEMFELTTSGAHGFVGHCAEMRWADDILMDIDDLYADGLPLEYTGSYGSEGFYLPFSDIGDLGRDFSGNGNDWVPVSSPTQSSDTPTQPLVIGSDFIHEVSGIANYSTRTQFNSFSTTGTYAYMRIAIGGAASQQCSFDNVSVGVLTGTDVDTVATPIPLLFGGSASVSVGTNERVWSDWLEFEVDTSGGIVVVADYDGTASYGGYLGSAGTGETWYKAAANSHDQSTATGFTQSGTDQWTIEQVQVSDVEPAYGDIITTLFTDTLGSNTGSLADYTTRMVYQIDNYSVGFEDFDEVRYTIEAPSTGSMIIDNFGAGTRSGSTDDFDAAPAELLFDGGSGYTITGSGVTKASDWLAHSFDKDSAPMIVWDHNSSASLERRATSGGVTRYIKASTNSYDQQTITGTTESSGHSNAVVKIEGKITGS